MNCPNCGCELDDFDDTDLDAMESARFGGFMAGRHGDPREPSLHIHKGDEPRRGAWLRAYDLGEIVRKKVEPGSLRRKAPGG